MDGLSESFLNCIRAPRSVHDEHLRARSFVVGDALSIADLALYSYIHRADEGGFELSSFSNLRRWFARIEERPRHVTIDTTPV